jgi:hypothetical protein
MVIGLPRQLSSPHYHERDEFNVADIIERWRFARDELHFDADYIRGRRIKSRFSSVLHSQVVGR